VLRELTACACPPWQAYQVLRHGGIKEENIVVMVRPCGPAAPCASVARCAFSHLLSVRRFFCLLLEWGGLEARYASVPDLASASAAQVQDDLVDNPFNPHPGKIFNRPGGPDVAAGVKPVRSSLAAKPLPASLKCWSREARSAPGS
jgi:hypothetical protein